MAKQKRKVSMPAGIRNKMIAATSMLMVSCIMMVSSTYAWFTLSTAPEVKNISTTVAGNGSLEIALMPPEGDVTKIRAGSGTSSESDGGSALTANTSWGNIVQLNDTSYGLHKVNLLPTSLAVEENVVKLTTPEYGADGRIASASTATADVGTYDSENAKFVKDTKFGVRGIGLVEGNELTTYGYVVDLAVRLNTAKEDATSGKLLLQSEGVQRISGSTNTGTMGNGSYMQFDTVQPGIDLKTLLDSIRITFVKDYGKSGGTPTVIGNARLDTEAAGITTGATTLTSTEEIPLYLCTEKASQDQETGETAISVTRNSDNSLLELTKNETTQISAIVWLDGSTLTNASVAASQVRSMTGTLNLQFATDVTLTPAKNAELMNPLS